MVVRRTVEEMYARRTLSAEATREILDASLDPRGPDLLFDWAARLGLKAAGSVLDVGCRDGAQLVELHRRTGCTGVGIDPIADNLDRASDTLADLPITLLRGAAEAVPFADATFDLVWVRDVLVHVEPLAQALAECRRVLRSGSPALIYQMFGTPWLEPPEARRLWAPLAVVPANTDREHFEQAVASAGFRIEHREELQSEWREHAEEHGDTITSRRLVWTARLLRQPEHFKAKLGEAVYAGELANGLWGIYQMIGKLSPAIYVLR